MSEFYDYGARNGLSIVTDSGRVTQIRFVDTNKETVILKRGIANSKSFLSTLESFMINHAEHRPHKFNELFFSLTDDEEALKLAKNVYDLHMDKRFYPLEDIKALMSEQVTPFTTEELDYYGTANLHRVGLKNGIVATVYNGNQVNRKDPEFISTITSFLMNFVEMRPKEFMELYDAIENDKICFKIADGIRKETARKWNTLFRFKEEGSSTSNTVRQSFSCEPIFSSDSVLVLDGIITGISKGNDYIARDNATFYDVLAKTLRAMSYSYQGNLEKLCDSIRSDETYYSLARGILDSTREKMAQLELETTHCYQHQSLF